MHQERAPSIEDDILLGKNSKDETEMDAKQWAEEYSHCENSIDSGAATSGQQQQQQQQQQWHSNKFNSAEAWAAELKADNAMAMGNNL